MIGSVYGAEGKGTEFFQIPLTRMQGLFAVFLLTLADVSSGKTQRMFINPHPNLTRTMMVRLWPVKMSIIAESRPADFFAIN